MYLICSLYCRSVMPIVLLLYSFIVLANLFLISYFSYININFYINLYLQNSITDQLKTCTHGACNCTIQSFITGPYSIVLLSHYFLYIIYYEQWKSQLNLTDSIIRKQNRAFPPRKCKPLLMTVVFDFFFFLELCYSSKVYVILINYFYDFPVMRLKFWNDWWKWFTTWVFVLVDGYGSYEQGISIFEPGICGIWWWGSCLQMNWNSWCH